MWKPLGVRIGWDVWPGCILAMFSARMDGSWVPRRQPSEPPSMFVLLSE